MKVHLLNLNLQVSGNPTRACLHKSKIRNAYVVMITHLQLLCVGLNSLAIHTYKLIATTTILLNAEHLKNQLLSITRAGRHCLPFKLWQIRHHYMPSQFFSYTLKTWEGLGNRVRQSHWGRYLSLRTRDDRLTQVGKFNHFIPGQHSLSTSVLHDYYKLLWKFQIKNSCYVVIFYGASYCQTFVYTHV